MNFARLGAYVAFLAIVVDFLVSGTLLSDLGSSYVSEGGSLLVKIHPGSYLAILAGIFSSLDNLHGAVGLRKRVTQDGLIVSFLLGMTFCCLYALACTGAGGLIALIDSFLPAGMLALALSGMGPALQCRLRQLLQGLLFMNAGLAILEAATQWHAIPIVLSGGLAAAEFRSTAFYDHPLTGAAATMMGLFLTPNLSRKPVLGMCYAASMVAALLSFSERTPLVLAVLSMIAGYVGVVKGKVMRRCLHWQSAIWACTGMTTILVLAIAALASGLGSRLSEHLYWDASAQVRLAQFGILNALSASEVIFGCRRADLIALIEPLRLTYGVEVLENFWLVMLATLGILCFPIFVISLFFLLWSLWQRSHIEGKMMVIGLLITASASNSLGRKSTLLAMLVACVASTFSKPGQTAPRMECAVSLP